MKVAEVVGRTLSGLGVEQVFGVVGSGNFHVTNALIAGGANFVAARHEHGAAMMADGYSRMSNRVSVVSLHQGCGLTNAMTAITEATKSRTPLLVVVGDTPPTDPNSNFWIRQTDVITAVGAESDHVYTAASASADAARAYRRAKDERRTVVLHLPVDLQEEEVDWRPEVVPPERQDLRAGATVAAVRQLGDLLAAAQRPIIVAGRGALAARLELERLAEVSGALLATSAVARGLFAGNEWYLDVVGGFGTPLSTQLLSESDLVVAFGASLNRWTTRDGALLKEAYVVQVDTDPTALGRHYACDLGLAADAAEVATSLTLDLAARGGDSVGYRSAKVRSQIQQRGRWPDVPYADTSTAQLIDPRTLTIALDAMLPSSRVVVPDAGNFGRYPATFLSVSDAQGFCLPLAFQSIGMALGAAVGAAVASPRRTVIAGIGDGGFMMSLTELDTAVRLNLPLVVVVYNDSAYGAEVHRYGPEGASLETVVFPETDIAAVARGFGCRGLTVRTLEDLEPVRLWAQDDRKSPMVIDAKITSFASWLGAQT